MEVIHLKCEDLENFKFGELEINDICVSHLHDKNGENWFDDNAGAYLLGISPKTYRKHVRNIESSSESFAPIMSKTLRVSKTGRPRRYVNFGMITMIAGRSRSDKAMSIVILAGKLLNEKYNQVHGYSQSEDILEQEALVNIQQLKDTSQYYRQLALDSKSDKDFIKYTNLSDEYDAEAKKTYFQRENTSNCVNREKNDIKLNQQGILTEKGKHPVLLPAGQTKLFDFMGGD